MERLSCFDTTDEPMELPPGFRFHPTDEELITHYLSPKVLDSSFTAKAVGDVDLNKVEPWDLPWKAKMGEKEWYFFCVRDRKYPTGSRTNRATDAGYWKVTGKDKEIYSAQKTLVGMKKTLVFYRGRAPRGEKTNWVMHEYRLEGNPTMQNLHRTAKNEWVICRVFKKISGGNKVHISGLVRSRDCGADSQPSDLPPLTDLSSDENQTRTTTAAEGSNITCFSNPLEEHPDKSVDEFSSSSKPSDFPPVPFTFPKVSNPNSTLSPQIVSCSTNFHCPDSVSLQDESILRLLLEKNGPFMKQNVKAEFSQDIGMNSTGDLGFKPHDDQEFPIISTGPVDFDCFWNY